MTPRRRDSAGVSNFLEDSLFDLADPHTRQAVDLSDLLKGVRTVLCSDHDAVVSLRMRDPMLTTLSLAIYTSFGLNGKTCGAVQHL